MLPPHITLSAANVAIPLRRFADEATVLSGASDRAALNCELAANDQAKKAGKIAETRDLPSVPAPLPTVPS
jgi:hypothetical protein